MRPTELASFEGSLHTTNLWLKKLMDKLGEDDRQRAYRALRAVLHALRDRLSVNEAAALGAQLPMLVRGFYYEGWHPANKPLKERRKEEFLAHVADAFWNVPGIDPERVARSVLELLAEQVTAGEIERIKHVLPPDIRSLWPATAPTHA